MQTEGIKLNFPDLDNITPSNHREETTRIDVRSFIDCSNSLSSRRRSSPDIHYNAWKQTFTMSLWVKPASIRMQRYPLCHLV